MIDHETEQNAMRAALGAMILDPNALALGLAVLRDDAMTGYERYILGALRRLAAAHKPIDSIIVAQDLALHDELAAANAPCSILATLDYACALQNLETVCGIVNGEAMRRVLKIACLETVQAISAGNSETAELLAVGERKILNVRDPKQAQGFEPLAVIFDRMLTRPALRLPTGYHRLDQAT